jgi:uncharacterized protein
MTSSKIVIIRPLLLLCGALMLASTASIHAGDAQALAAYEAKNYREAMHLFRPLAEQGDRDAQYYVGRMYEKGQGVRKDAREVVTWYRRAAEGGHAAAQYRLAVGYAFGFAGLPHNDKAAVEWLRKSAEGGYKRAQKTLGRAYAEGRFGLPVDTKQAEYWTKKAEANS